MSALGDLLRSELGLPRKYTLNVVDGDTAPFALHVDGVTKWRNRRPVKYTRATNELRVGRQWLEREFPASYALTRLAGKNGTPNDPAPVDIYWRTWRKEHAQSNIIVPAWPSRDVSTDPENERLYA